MPLTIVRKTPIKIRRLKNADRVEQFFFMYFEGHEMAEWLRLEFEVDLVALAPFTFEIAQKNFLLVAFKDNWSNTFFVKATETLRETLLLRVAARVTRSQK
jgi:hypothetical protein